MAERVHHVLEAIHVVPVDVPVTEVSVRLVFDVPHVRGHDFSRDVLLRHDALLKHGHLELLAREEEIRFLKVRTDEESRQLLLSKKTAPVEGEKRAELEKLRVQLIDCQKNLTKLEQRVEDCHNPERVRMLEGHEDSVDDLIAKMEQIETKLTRVEEQCLEKDLILEQVRLGAGNIFKIKKKTTFI